jgi:NitT/TauT family transport system substrate-binding protein
MPPDPAMLSARTVNRRGLLKGGAAVALTLAGEHWLAPPARSQATIGLSEQLGWLANAQMAGDFVAIGKGFFRDAGIDLRIQPGGPSIDAVQIVAGGGTPIGNVSSIGVLINARSRGLPVKAFATALQRHPFAFMFLTKSGIRTPRDFEGKTIGIQATARPLLEAVLAKYQIPKDKVKVQLIGGDTRPLVTGQVDVVTGWVIDAPQMDAIEGAGSFSYFRLWDLGIRMYAYTYFTTDRVLQERKDALARFLSASARGWTYASQHPDEALDMVMSHTTGLDRTLELKTWKNEIPYLFSPITKQRGWGYMDPKLWEDLSGTYLTLQQIPRAVSAAEVMTNDIVEMAKTPKG